MEIAFILICVVIVFASLMLMREIGHVRKQFESETSHLDQRIRQLEEAARKRVPYRTQEELLDAMAALDAFDREVDLGKAMIHNAKAHIAKGLEIGTKREEK